MKHLDFRARAALTISTALILMGAAVAFVTNFSASGPTMQATQTRTPTRTTKVVTVYVTDTASRSPVSSSTSRTHTRPAPRATTATPKPQTRQQQPPAERDDNTPPAGSIPLSLCGNSYECD